MKKNRQRLQRIMDKLNLRTKLILVLLCTSVIVFLLNVFIYANLNKMVAQIDTVYESNASLSKLQSMLGNVQQNLEEYLNTKSTDSLENYFVSEQEFRMAIAELNDVIVSDDSLLMEKNIHNMSEDYLDLSGRVIDAKRSRNVSKYRGLYEELEVLYEYIDTYIYSLNNMNYQNNTENYEALVATLTYSEMITMVIFLMVGGLNIVLILVLVRGITKPLKELAIAADKVAGGDLDVRIRETNSRDEVGVVARAFNKMVISLNQHIVQLKESMEKESALKERELLMQNHLKDAQLKYLQVQINPHFLFNTLNAGVQLAMMEEAPRTYEYIQNTADFYRYNLRNTHMVVTLGDELQMTDYYMYIMKVRFSSEIGYTKQIDEELLDMKLPSMILQPVVENSMKYGIADIEWQGEIKIVAERVGDQVLIQISDNGRGMEQEKIDEIINRPLEEREISEDKESIGLDNAISRLQLYYNCENIIEIHSDGEDMGTEVVFTLPAETKETEHV